MQLFPKLPNYNQTLARKRKLGGIGAKGMIFFHRRYQEVDFFINQSYQEIYFIFIKSIKKILIFYSSEFLCRTEYDEKKKTNNNSFFFLISQHKLSE